MMELLHFKTVEDLEEWLSEPTNPEAFARFEPPEYFYEDSAPKKETWKRAPLRIRLAIWGLNAVSVICSFTVLLCAMWIIEPLLNRVLRHPLTVIGGIASGFIVVYCVKKSAELEKR